MKSHVTFCALSIAAVLLMGATFLAAERPARDDDQAAAKHAASGAYLFKTYCASCHGTSARGDGPLAGSMRRRPPNLTEIARRNGGMYPTELVYRTIDGRQPIRGHGGPDMPVWGDAFLRSADSADEASVRARIQALVDFLETIQATDSQ